MSNVKDKPILNYTQIPCVNSRCENLIYLTNTGARAGGEIECRECSWRTYFYQPPMGEVETFERSFQMIKRRDEEFAKYRQRITETGQVAMF